MRHRGWTRPSQVLHLSLQLPQRRSHCLHHHRWGSEALVKLYFFTLNVCRCGSNLRCATNVTESGDLADGNSWGYCSPGCFDVQGKKESLRLKKNPFLKSRRSFPRSRGAAAHLRPCRSISYRPSGGKSQDHRCAQRLRINQKTFDR